MNTTGDYDYNERAWPTRRRPSALMGILLAAAMIGGGLPPTNPVSAPMPTPQDDERRKRAEAERIEAARLKRERKAARKQP